MSEIRVRDVSPQLMKQANEIAAHFNEKTITAALEKLIIQFTRDQKTLEENRKEINRLGNELRLLQEREQGVKNILDQVMYIENEARSYLLQTGKQAFSLKQLMSKKKIPAGTKKRSIKRSSSDRRKAKKIVPARKKKGGKK